MLLSLQQDFQFPGSDPTRPNAMFVLRRDEYFPPTDGSQPCPVIRRSAAYLSTETVGRYYELYWLVNQVIDEHVFVF
jgi:hypothetical protein